jgi:hypothetical protein
MHHAVEEKGTAKIVILYNTQIFYLHDWHCIPSSCSPSSPKKHNYAYNIQYSLLKIIIKFYLKKQNFVNPFFIIAND